MWAYDFVFDACANGQQLKCLTVIDEFTRESLAIDVAGSILRVPAMTDSCSGDDGHHRSEATQAGWLLYRLSAMVPRGIGLAHRLR